MVPCCSFSANRDYYPVHRLLELAKAHPRACGDIQILWNGIFSNSLRFLVELEVESGPVVFSDRSLAVEIKNVDSKLYSLIVEI